MVEIAKVIKVYPATISIRPGVMGGYTIVISDELSGDFEAVTINYNYCYMDNSRSHWFAENIAKVLAGTADIVERAKMEAGGGG